jgi:hypothetical protein
VPRAAAAPGAESGPPAASRQFPVAHRYLIGDEQI